MSRPPRPVFKTPTTGDGSGFAQHRHFLPIEFADFVNLERELAETEARLGLTEQTDRIAGHQPSGDFAATLMELSALVGHTLGLYQNLYAREAYLGTAETSRSLVLHARRLAYEPDQGLSASGYAALTVGEGLNGTVPKGFALASSPQGEVKAQTYETLDDVDVDSKRNSALPVDREKKSVLSLQDGERKFRLRGIGLNLTVGEYALLYSEKNALALPVSIQASEEDAEADVTTITFEIIGSTTGLAASYDLAASDLTPTFRFLAMPKQELRRFGWDSNPVQFPPKKVNETGSYPTESLGTEAPGTAKIESTNAPGNIRITEDITGPVLRRMTNPEAGTKPIKLPEEFRAEFEKAMSLGDRMKLNALLAAGILEYEKEASTEIGTKPSREDRFTDQPVENGTSVTWGYDVTLDSGGTDQSKYTYLSMATKANLEDQLVIAKVSQEWTVLRVQQQGSASVAFRRTEERDITVGIIKDDGTPGTETQTFTFESAITGTVTYLELADLAASTVNRSQLTLQTPIYADWQYDEPVLATEPNDATVVFPLTLDADFGDFRPGGFVAFETLNGSTAEVREVLSLEIISSDPPMTEISCAEPEPESSQTWTLDNLRVLGNVAPITHGETHREILGGSDGVEPFQNFELKKSPLTQVPGVDGGIPDIKVRVNEVAWTRVDDFYDSKPGDRHYRLEFDEDQGVRVIFGNGRNGAVPPSGKKHIRAEYRFGLGLDGEVGAGAASRIKKAHPLIERASNPSAISGGADPAGFSDLKRQATQFIRTFDRAVSLQDHANLALLYPGVARAAARRTPQGGIEVIVAKSDGTDPPLDAVKKFLNARRDESLPMTVTGAVPRDVYLDVSIEYDPAYLSENVKRAVQDALRGDSAESPGMFTFAGRDFGQAAYLSEVYACVTAAKGVTFVKVTRFRLGIGVGVKDVLRAEANQWLNLQAKNLLISIEQGTVA